MKMNWKNPKLDRLRRRLSGWWNAGATLSLRGKSVSFQPARLGLVLAASLLALVILVNLLLIPSRRLRTVDMDFETGGTYSMIPINRDILMYNKQHVKAVNTKGKTLWSVDIALSLPMVETAGDYVLVADLGGNNFAGLYKNGTQQQEFKLGNDIISAKVNKGGDTAFATATDGYKGKVTVMDKKGKELFSWNSGDGYIMDIALNSSGRYLAVAQLLSDGDQASSRIQFIDMHQKKVIQTADWANTVIGELRFSGGKLLSVSDAELCGFSDSGRLLYTVSFAGKKPSKYDISSDELLAFVTSDNRGNAVLELYSTNGKRKGQYYADSSVGSLAVCGDMVAFARQRDLIYVNQWGKLKKKVSSAHDVKNLGIFGDARTVLAAGSTSADIVRMR